MKMNAAMAERWERLQRQIATTALAARLKWLAGGRLRTERNALALGGRPVKVTDALVNELLRSGQGRIPEDMDATEFEAWTNKIHIADYLDAALHGDALLAQGVLYAQALAASLLQVGTPTRIVLSRDPDSDEVTVRFFVRRPDSPWGAEDPNDYPLEEVIQWDIDPERGPGAP